MPLERDFDAMEEPVPCPVCGDWAELQSVQECRDCQRLVCRTCIKQRIYTDCEEIAAEEAEDDD